ncbi:hypothetical protein BASA50_007754 [Batrachochytrium salamandrivorans]|uniref:Uncharacterized protein n=1 Tax=Batrachochytrium salamandrivorans TaxID=1357716 RepID=A0ABQ8F655_9FUNG|nr:hypothetical protein BASA50_007754 [Batrachochytrium salamandrivorans]
MKVAAATILSLVATAAYASPTAYSETQEVGTHDSTAESSSDSYLEKRGGGFYGNYAQGAGGVHNAQFNHWNHRSHETGGHHQYPQTHNSPRLYGPNQWRHTPVSRDLGPYEKLRQKQQEQQQQYQQYQQRRQQHDQQQQQYQQHHQQQHQQQSALQQYQQQRQQQRQQQQQEQQQRLEQYQRQHQQRQHEQRQRQENNYRFSPYEMLRHKQQQQRQQQQQYHQQQENSSPYNQYGVHRQYNHQPQSWGSRGTSSSHGMNQHAQQPHYWKDRGPSSQYGVRHQYTQPLQYQEDRGTSSSPEMNQNAQPVEGGNNGAGVDAETEETVKVELGGESNTGNNNPEGGNGGPEVQPENDNNPKSGTSGSNAEAASDESGDKSTGPADSTKTGESGEVKSEGGANGGEPEAKESFVGSKLWNSIRKDLDKPFPPLNSQEHDQDVTKTSEQSKVEITGPGYVTKIEETVKVEPEGGAEGGESNTGNNTPEGGNNNPEGGNGGPEVQPENDNNPKSGTSGSNAETASGESGDKSTGPADGTKTGDDNEVKPEVETTQSKTKRPSLSRSVVESVRQILNKQFPSPNSQKHKQDMAKTSKKSKVKITGPKYDSGTEESDDSDSDSEGEYVFGGYDESENENNKLENDNNPKSGTSGSDAETASGESGDKSTGPGDSTGTEETVEVEESGAKGGESNAEDAKLEDGAAKPEDDRDSAFKLPWDSFMQERKNRPLPSRVRNYDFYMTKKSEEPEDRSTVLKYRPHPPKDNDKTA